MDSINFKSIERLNYNLIKDTTMTSEEDKKKFKRIKMKNF